MNAWKEIAKFVCGWEAFHALLHVFLLMSGDTLTVFGITTTPTLDIVGVIICGSISLILGLYAWEVIRLPSRTIVRPSH